ncbi:MAG: SLC13 family permease [Candidatus Hodarchaeota archaeon]
MFPQFGLITQDLNVLTIGVFLTVIFLIVLLVIATEKIDKVSITLTGVVISLFIALTFGLIKNLNILYLWIDLELLLTIIGITLIMEMLKKSGILEVFILYILSSIKGSFDILMVILASSVFFMSMIMTNVLALIIIAQITILIAEVAEINPKPMLFLELVISNLAGMLTPIASYTAAYVSLEQGWTYLEFLLISLPYVSIMVTITIIFTRYIMFRDVMLNMKEKERSFGFQLRRILQIIDPWVFVDSKRDFYKAIVIFSVVTVFFAVGTTIGFSVDIICLLGGMIVLIMFSENVEEFIRSIDFPMLFFLCGIFIMSGLIQETNLPLLLNDPITQIVGQSPILGITVFSWILGALTSIIENIPLIFLLRPLIDLISSQTNAITVWWAILAVVNITDSAILISSVKGIYIMEMSKREGMPIGFMEYFRYGVSVTIIHLVGMVVYIFILLGFN